MPTFGEMIGHERKLVDLMRDITAMGMQGLAFEARMRYAQLQIELLSRLTARHVITMSMLFDVVPADEELTDGEARLLDIMDGVVDNYREMARDEAVIREKVRWN